MRALLFSVVTSASTAALTCPVCGTAKAPNDWAFGVTTLLLSVLPPIIFGSIVFFLVRAHRKARREEEIASISTPD